MASSPEEFSSKIILVAKLQAKPGRGDELQRLLADLRKAIESGAEPGCLTYRASRAGEAFNVYEEYVDKAAFTKHSETEHFKGLSSVQDVIARPPTLAFYEEFGNQ